MKSDKQAWARCLGWWEQSWYGRQPMNNLRLSFADGRIEGLGDDMIGSFTLSGRLRPDGVVTILKQYIGQHSVDYVGSYDGEGVLSGQWHIGDLHGNWLIRIGGLDSLAEADIQEYVPQS